MLRTGEARNINRGVIDERSLIERLGDSESVFHKIARRYFWLLEKRLQTRAFHPNSAQTVMEAGDAVFAVLRTTADGTESVLSLVNVTDSSQEISIPGGEFAQDGRRWKDLLGDLLCKPEGGALKVSLTPYQVVWLSPED